MYARRRSTTSNISPGKIISNYERFLWTILFIVIALVSSAIFICFCLRHRHRNRINSQRSPTLPRRNYPSNPSQAPPINSHSESPPPPYNYNSEPLSPPPYDSKLQSNQLVS